MGMDYVYSGSASYPRFREEINQIDHIIRSDDVIFVSWINNPYKELSYEDTQYIYEIIDNFIKINPDIELPWQPVNELTCCLEHHEGWYVYE